eukprot:scaffold1449_cov244-Pinguiococcus_pyrenoidosus.AAC.14
MTEKKSSSSPFSGQLRTSARLRRIRLGQASRPTESPRVQCGAKWKLVEDSTLDPAFEAARERRSRRSSFFMRSSAKQVFR